MTHRELGYVIIDSNIHSPPAPSTILKISWCDWCLRILVARSSPLPRSSRTILVLPPTSLAWPSNSPNGADYVYASWVSASVESNPEAAKAPLLHHYQHGRKLPRSAIHRRWYGWHDSRYHHHRHHHHHHHHLSTLHTHIMTYYRPSSLLTERQTADVSYWVIKSARTCRRRRTYGEERIEYKTELFMD